MAQLQILQSKSRLYYVVCLRVDNAWMYCGYEGSKLWTPKETSQSPWTG